MGKEKHLFPGGLLLYYSQPRVKQAKCKCLVDGTAAGGVER
jgi:hypothetical protein